MKRESCHQRRFYEPCSVCLCSWLSFSVAEGHDLLHGSSVCLPCFVLISLCLCMPCNIMANWLCSVCLCVTRVCVGVCVLPYLSLYIFFTPSLSFSHSLTLS